MDAEAFDRYFTARYPVLVGHVTAMWGDPGAAAVTMPESMLTVTLPTLVLWGLDDPALLPGLLDGLPGWVPHLQLQRVEGASHWLVHEMPERLIQALGPFLLSNQ